MTEKRISIFAEIHLERERQDAKWGVQNHPIRPEKSTRYFTVSADLSRELCDEAAENGTITWYHILREEFFEAMAESTLERQREELIQVIAVAVAMVENIDRNNISKLQY